MRTVREIKVGLRFDKNIQPVGRLAMRDQIVYFEYDDTFIQRGLEISPFRLPLQGGVLSLPTRPFEGLAGVFNDSLPDGWGRLLFDRLARSRGMLPSEISPLDRLAHVGLYGMGALVYEPDNSPSDNQEPIDLDYLAAQAEEILIGSSTDVLQELLALNGSSAGARPKALIGVDDTYSKITFGAKQLDHQYSPWLVKFSNSQDGSDAGAIEYVYALMAKEAGLNMPTTHLFDAKNSAGYFAVKRFDRHQNERLHMHTASGLLHNDFRVPSLDYEDLASLTLILTKDVREVEKLFRLAVFNVLAHNRDDHAKNFSFLMDSTGEWKFAPAYDLTFSSGPNGEQSTMVMGEGKKPSLQHLKKLGIEANLSKSNINEIIDQTQYALSKWNILAKNHNVSNSNIQLISKTLNEIS